MNFVNLTPHTVNIVAYNSEEKIEIEPSGIIARIDEKQIFTGVFHYGEENIATYKVQYGDIVYVNKAGEELNEPPRRIDNNCYIVSSMIAEKMKDKRFDFCAPANLIRDNKGNIIGCSGIKFF